MARKNCFYKKKDRDNNEDFVTKRCFEVSPNAQERGGAEEYLFTVMKERQNYAWILRCDSEKLRQKVIKNETPNYNEITIPVTAESVKPTIEWQSVQIADFSNVRAYMQRLIVKNRLPASIQNINLSKDRVKNWKPLFDNAEPTLTHVIGVSQSILDKGLDLLIERLDSVSPGQTIDRKTGQWIYTILAVTRYPHLKDTTSKLRSLARKCWQIRSNLNPEDDSAREMAAPMNLFICLIGRFFEQKDLAD